MTNILSRRCVIRNAMSLAVLVAMAGTGWAQASSSEASKQNYSGTWTLNVAKSRFGESTIPKSETEIITHSGSSLALSVISQMSDRSVTKYNVSVVIGDPAVPIDTRRFRPDDVLKLQNIQAEWNEDGALVVTVNALLNQQQATLKSTYTLSPDGKTLTKAVNVDVDSGAYDMTEVYEKS